MVDVSIIIRVWNEGNALRRTLNRIRLQKTDLDFEVIVVDSFSTDSTPNVAEEFGCKIVNVAREEFSWGRGLNIGLSHARGRFCILLSAHCYPSHNTWMERLVAPLLSDDRVAAAYGGQIPIRGVNPFEEVELGLWFPRVKKRRLVVSNSNACIRRSVWSEFKFNEDLKSYEDVEWALRVIHAGYSIVYVPDASVYHSHPLDFELMYCRWYWRARSAIVVRREESKVRLAAKFPSVLPAFMFSASFFFFWLFSSLLYYMTNKYVDYLLKAPLFEILRCHAIYRGIMDGLNDIKQRSVYSDEFGFVRLPRFITFIESILTNGS